jgi:hypothetical protein
MKEMSKESKMPKETEISMVDVKKHFNHTKEIILKVCILYSLKN